MPRWAKWLLMGIGAAIMAGTLFYFVHASWRAWAADDWPVAEGRVVANRIDISESTDEDGDSTSSFVPVVTFEYPVEGRRFRSDRLFLNERETFDTDSDVRAFLDQYRPGTALDVYYNPADPSDAAIIIEGPSWLVLLFVLMGAFFFAGGWLIPAERNRPPRRLYRFRRD